MAENPKELLANIPPFGLRMQAELKDRIKEAAEANNRSMNAEIVARLEASFEAQASVSLDDDTVFELARKLAEIVIAGQQARQQSGDPASKSFLGKLMEENDKDKL